MKTNIYLTAFYGAICLSIIHLILSAITAHVPDFNTITWGLFANYLVALLLGFYIINSNQNTLKTGISVFLIYFLIGHFNILIEAYIFNVSTRYETGREIWLGLITAIVFSPLYVNFFSSKKKPLVLGLEKRSPLKWLGRIVAGDFIYLFLYILAGFTLTIIYPKLLEFYEGKLPSITLLLQTQLFLRGFIFMGVAFLIIQTMNVSTFKRAVFIGLVFAILGGIAPLIPPNDLMPAYVRLGHAFEVGISNSAYGLILGYLLKSKMIAQPGRFVNEMS
ncbi:hypothetical protein [Eudoraea sp.]|uniref:hypothetical protein n=3 Tax=Eudoraea sp. TaxID=1979955 RepID=UPI003C78CB07